MIKPEDTKNMLFTNADFYCEDCRIDQTLHAQRKRGSGNAEWWQASCEKCGKKVIRRITDRNRDPYLWKSPKLQKERDKYARDLLQPSDGRFKLHYRKQWEEMEAKNERDEKSWKESQKSRDKFYEETLNKNFAKEVIKKGEEISSQPYGQ